MPGPAHEDQHAAGPGTAAHGVRAVAARVSPELAAAHPHLDGRSLLSGFWRTRGKGDTEPKGTVVMPDGRTVNVADIDIKPTSECAPAAR